jgi:hypothetical protein
MSMPQQDTRVRPAAWWYLVTVVLWIAAFVVFVVALQPIFSILSAGVDQVQNHRPINVTSDGFTVYASEYAVTASCSLTSRGGDRTTLTQFNRDSADNITFSADTGPDVHPIATTPEGVEPGTYLLSCKGVPPTASLATGKRLDFGDFKGRLAVGFIVSSICGVAGLVWLIVMLVRRHNGKQRVRQARAAAAYGYGGYPPGSYPGYPSSPQTGYPGSAPGAPSAPRAGGPPSGDASGTGYGAVPPPPSPGSESAGGTSEPPDGPEAPDRRS